MFKVAILDDYQNVSQGFVNLKKLSGKLNSDKTDEARQPVLLQS